MVGPRFFVSKASISLSPKLHLFGSRTIESQKHSFILVFKTRYPSYTNFNLVKLKL